MRDQDNPPLSAEHKRKISLAKRGENHHMNKLTERQVRQIRTWADLGDSFESIGRAFGVTGRQVGSIVRRENWGHID